MWMFSNRILLNQQQIEAINWQNLQRPATGLTDLQAMEPEQSLQTLQGLLEAEKLPQEPRYDGEGSRYGREFYDALKGRIEAGMPHGDLALRYGVVIQNSFLRAFPTMAASFRAGEWGELDRFAVTLLKLGEPVVVYCQDGSGQWSFVRSSQCVGWMLTEQIAWEEDGFRWRQYCAERNQLVVTDSRRTLDYIDFDGKAQTQLLLMGTRLPLYDADQRTFVAGLPTKDRRGKLAVLQFMARRDGGLAPGVLPLTAQNIVSQAKKMLGEPYGWGGSGFYRDCSSLLADVFSVFGLQFPRNSRQQMEMVGVERCPGEREQKYRWIAALPPGSALYFPGHAMLYLGRRGNLLEILHSVYAIGLPAAEQMIPHKIRRVVQGSLQQQRVNGELFLDAVTDCWVPERQKRFL